MPWSGASTAVPAGSLGTNLVPHEVVPGKTSAQLPGRQSGPPWSPAHPPRLFRPWLSTWTSDGPVATSSPQDKGDYRATLQVPLAVFVAKP